MPPRFSRRAIAAAALTLAAAGGTAAPAMADSISYIKDGDVWLSTGDGSRQFRVTQTGGYSDASQADDGTIVALKGVRLHKLDRMGNVVADFDTPVSDTRPPGSQEFFGPYEPAISPDGTKVAYSWFHVSISEAPGCRPPTCVTRDMRQGVGYSHADRQTGWEELGKHTGWRHPVWLPDGRVMLSEPGRLPNADVVTDDVLDNSNTTWANWFTDNGTPGLSGGDVSRDGAKLAFVGGGIESDQVRIYRSKGAAPEPPEACYSYDDPVGGKILGSPTFSPDGRQLAWAEADGVRAVDVPDLSAGCTTDGASPQTRVLIPGATEPDWGPADVPADRPATQTGSGTGTGTSSGSADQARRTTAARRAALKVRKARLRKALARGVTVRVSGVPAGKVKLTGKVRGRVVARGSGRAGTEGTATVRLTFTKAARRALRSKARVKLAVSGAGAKRIVTLKR